MNNIDWKKLGYAVAQVEENLAYIESQKSLLRELADKDLINEYVLVSRSNSPVITYSAEYKAEEAKYKAELKAKYPPTKIDRPNYRIELTALQKSTDKVEATQKCAKLTAKTITKRIAASKNAKIAK